MPRNIHIIATGVGSNERPFARGVIDFEGDELAAVVNLAAQAGIPVPSAGFGLISGIPDENIAKLSPGDDIQAENVVVRNSTGTYEKDGETKTGIDTRIAVGAGACTRQAAVMATCDW